MTNSPNLLIIVADGMQADVVEANHPCQTAHLQQLAHRGVSFRRAHTTSPTCSPARASLMTGLLPHNHGVLEVEHGRDPDQCVLRTEHPHFAQRVSDVGYRTGYFGKWHIERTQNVAPFGWQEAHVKGAEHIQGLGRGDPGPANVPLDPELSGYLEGPPGYQRILHWGVTDVPLEDRHPGLTAIGAEPFLKSCLAGDQPWCCCVSFSEPNEALVVGREMWNLYDPRHNESVTLPQNFNDDLSDRPNIYQREQRIGRQLSEDHWRAARACYFGRITEVDMLVGRLLALVGQLDDTIVIFVADHGRYVGAHGFDAHNFGAFEEAYRIPLIVAGQGVATGQTSDALVSIADLSPTICDIAKAATIDAPDSKSFARILESPNGTTDDFRIGYAEYHGTRFPLMQRVLWEGEWKFVFNGFDFDELYHLGDDPHEMTNLIADPAHQSRVESMMTEIWRRVRDTNDRAIHESHYFSMRLACVGPDAAM